MGLDTFTGNPRIVSLLRSKLENGRFPHGLIFSGPEGVGKRTLAMMMAKALNCLQGPPGDFCDSCSACRKIQGGVHPDIQSVGIEEGATEIRIAQIRQVLQMLDLQPLEGRNKVFIFDPANAMNAAATNALLKGLEEPPDNSFFILLSVNVHELLPTVRSRCQVYHFTPVPLEELRDLAAGDEFLLRWSRGSIGRLRALDAGSLKHQRESILEFLEIAATAPEVQFKDLLAASGDLSRAKADFDSNLEVLTVVLNDLLYMREGAPERIINIDVRERLEALSNRLPQERLIALADFLWTIESSLKTHVNRQLLTDVLALTANETVSKILHDKTTESR